MTFDRRQCACDTERRPGLRYLGTRPAGGTPPLTLPTTNLLMALEARAGVTTVSGVVSAWAGQHGTSVSATQGTAGKRPTLVTISGGALDGHLAVRADGVDNIMTLSGLTASAGPVTAYFVCAHAAPSGVSFARWLDSQTGRLAFGIVSDDYAITRVIDNRFTSVVPGAHAGRVTFQVSSSTGRLWVDDTEATSIVTNANVALGGTSNLFANFADSSGWSALDLVAVYLYTAAHDATARASVWDYIAQEWGV